MFKIVEIIGYIKRKQSIFLYAIIALFLLAACNSNQTTESEPINSENSETEQPATGPKYGGNLEIIMVFNARNIGYPADPSATSTVYYYQPAIESLGRYNEEGIIEPFLAKSWDLDPANNKIIFHLHEGIKFHDGTDFNAEALKWNIEQWIEQKRGEVDSIISMEVLSDYSLQLNLDEWNSGLLESVAYYVGVISPTAVKENGIEWAMANPVGTGPFIFESWERDVSITFVKNDNYWQEGKPYLDSVKYLIIPDQNTAANVFKSGEGHVLQSMRPDAFLELEKSGNYKFNNNGGLFGGLGVGITFDSVSPDSPFSDIRVRQAVAHAIDNEAIVESVLRGQAIATNQYYLPGLRYYNENVKGYDFDPERAKQLLAEAGYPDGFQTTITIDTPRLPTYTAVQSFLSDIGIDMNIVNLDTGQLVANYISGEWEGMISMVWPISPGSSYGAYFSGDSLQFNNKIIRMDEIEEAIEAAKLAPTEEEKIEKIKRMDEILVDKHALYVPMHGLVSNIAIVPELQNFSMFTTNSFDWHPEEVWIEQ